MHKNYSVFCLLILRFVYIMVACFSKNNFAIGGVMCGYFSFSCKFTASIFSFLSGALYR